MTISIPHKCHPLMRSMWQAIHQRGITYRELSRLSGVDTHTIRNWRNGTSPTIANLEAVLNVVGFKLAVHYIKVARFK